MVLSPYYAFSRTPQKRTKDTILENILTTIDLFLWTDWYGDTVFFTSSSYLVGRLTVREICDCCSSYSPPCNIHDRKVAPLTISMRHVILTVHRKRCCHCSNLDGATLISPKKFKCIQCETTADSSFANYESNNH